MTVVGETMSTHHICISVGEEDKRTEQNTIQSITCSKVVLNKSANTKKV